MAKRKRTMIYETLHRKLKIEQHKLPKTVRNTAQKAKD